MIISSLGCYGTCVIVFAFTAASPNATLGTVLFPTEISALDRGCLLQSTYLLICSTHNARKESFLSSLNEGTETTY